jgi:timeless
VTTIFQLQLFFDRLSVNLTNPALLVYNEVIPKDKTDHNQYLEIISHLQSYKEAFTDHKPWIVITERLSELLNIVSMGIINLKY